jgi:hypothetical protein
LLLGTVFTYVAASYAPLLDLALCLTGAILAGRALHWKEYSLAAGFIALVVAASPFQLESKIFVLMGLACIGASATVFTRIPNTAATNRLSCKNKPREASAMSH